MDFVESPVASMFLVVVIGKKSGKLWLFP